MVMERISSFMDGELGDHEAGQQLNRLKTDPEARASWDTFHLIGDAMRGDSVVSRDFSARLQARLAAEPTVLAPRPRRIRPATTYALSAAASLSAVALVGWMAANNLVLRGTDAPPAPPAPPQVAEIPNVPSDGQMKEYVMAHTEFSPSTAIQGVASYIRTVSAVKGAE